MLECVHGVLLCEEYRLIWSLRPLDCAPAHGSKVRLFEPVFITGLKAGATTLILCAVFDGGRFWRHPATDFGCVCPLTPMFEDSTVANMTNIKYLPEYDAIANTMQMYIDGSRQGKSELMRPAFHPNASFFGYAGEQLAIGTAFLFDWIDKNGPAPDIQPRLVSVDIVESIAVVRLEVAGWSGVLAGSGVHMSDLFTLLKTQNGWKIIQKAFHWHS